MKKFLASVLAFVLLLGMSPLYNCYSYAFISQASSNNMWVSGKDYDEEVYNYFKDSSYVWVTGRPSP